MSSDAATRIAPTDREWQLVATCNLGTCPSVYSGSGREVLVQGYITADAPDDGVLIPTSILREAASTIFDKGNHDV